MLDFVRLKFDGSLFTSENNAGGAEGSRASAKFSWHSQLDVVNDWSDPDGNSGYWIRNPAASAANDIGVGPIDVSTPEP
jgi:hypothetical protein